MYHKDSRCRKDCVLIQTLHIQIGVVAGQVDTICKTPQILLPGPVALMTHIITEVLFTLDTRESGVK